MTSMLLDFSDLVVSLVELPDSYNFGFGVEAESAFEFLSPLVDEVFVLPSVFVVFVVRPSEVAMDDLRFSFTEDDDTPRLVDFPDLVVSLVELPDSDMFALGV